MKELLSMTRDELKSVMMDIGAKPFASGQVMKWLSSGVPFGEMTNISKEMRLRLAEGYQEGYAVIREKYESVDGTVKYLMEMAGGGLVECVVMRYHHGNTLCVSTQLGCRMGCVFCASGQDGLVRNLSAGEMRSQFIAAHDAGDISNVVLMGSGEPLDNYDNVIAFVRMLGEYHGVSIRHISLSTCGIVPGILQLADEGLPLTLCLSLHAATDEKRRQIMPVANAYTIRQILDAANNYFKNTGRRIIIEYTLIKEFNDGSDDIDALVSITGGLNCHINVIPLNHAAGKLMPPTARQVKAFADALNRHGRSATVRRSLGSDIEGACGQLKLKREKI